MALARLEFDLSDPHQELEHRRCIKSADMAYLIYQIKHNLLRDMLTDRDSCEYMNGVEDTVRQIFSYMKELDINADELA